VEARNAVAIARFYAFRHITHTTGWPMHLLKGGVGGSGGGVVPGWWVVVLKVDGGLVRWCQHDDDCCIMWHTAAIAIACI